MHRDAFPDLIIAIKQSIDALKNLLIYIFLKCCVTMCSSQGFTENKCNALYWKWIPAKDQ